MARALKARHELGEEVAGASRVDAHEGQGRPRQAEDPFAISRVGIAFRIAFGLGSARNYCDPNGN